jgi:fatty-acyl-CoA synthase
MNRPSPEPPNDKAALPHDSPARLHDKAWPRRVPHDIPSLETTLWENLEITARRLPDKTALVFFGRQISYTELKAQVDRLAGWLQHDAGLAHGDRVVLMLQNSPQFVIGFYAIMRAGGVVVPANPMSRADELSHYIADSGAKLAICAADLAPHMIRGSDQLDPAQRLRHLLIARYPDLIPTDPAPEDAPPGAWRDWLHADPELPSWGTRWAEAMMLAREPQPYRGKPDDLVALGYTSGTTGRPKGCMHTHRTIGHNTVAGALWTHASMNDVSFGVVPMFHITGMQYSMHVPIYLGSTNVVLPRWDRELAGHIISRYKVTTWTNIPTMIIDLLGSPNIASFDLTSLEQIGGGGAAMPQAVAEKLERQFGLRYMEGYGLTETAAPSHSNPSQAPKLQCLGIPFIGTDSRVVDPDTLKELPQGETGEIVVHGPQVFVGYWERPAETEAAFFELDGKRFFRTGDLGRVDEDGYYFITDRLKRMINASGFKVWPAEVESMLFKHPAVQEACIISARDAYRGETVKAVIVLRDEARGRTTADDIRSWAREQMAAYKVPQFVEFVDALPKSGSGKVMWRLLQEKEAQA